MRLLNNTAVRAVLTAEPFCWRMHIKPSHRSVNPSVSIRRIASELSVGVGTVYKVLDEHEM